VAIHAKISDGGGEGRRRSGITFALVSIHIPGRSRQGISMPKSRLAYADECQRASPRN